MASHPVKAPDPSTNPGLTPWTPTASDAAAVLLVVGALLFAYESSVRALVGQWNRDPNYSYGFFVVPIAAVVFWSRRGLLNREKMRPRWWGFLPLVAVVAARFPLYEWNEQYVETATLPLVAAGLALAIGGWHLLRVALPSILFLCFMIPLPPSFNAIFATRLQSVATWGSVQLLQIIGVPVVSEGNVIIIGATPLEVARACNGLSMLLSFVTLVAATVILVERPMLERVILMLSAVPIAIISNVLRIAATAICYDRLGQAVGDKVAHDLAGYAMMPVALALVWLELKILSWVFVETEEVVDAAAFLRQRRGTNPAGH